MSLSKELMICAICRHVASRAVTCQHCSGGIFCEECSQSLIQSGANNCPNCRHTPLDVRPNMQLRSIIDSAQLFCTYCHTQVKADILEEHEEVCDLKPRKCGFKGCKFETGYIETALRHLSDTHGLNIWRNFTRLSLAASEGIENACITCQNLNEQLEAAEQHTKDLMEKEAIYLRLQEMYRKEIADLKSKLEQETTKAITAEAQLAELRGVQQTQEKRSRLKEESLKLRVNTLEDELRTTRSDFEGDIRAFELAMRSAMQRLTGRHLLGGIDGGLWGPPGACSAVGVNESASGPALTLALSNLTSEDSSGKDCAPAPGLTANAHESLIFLASIDFNPRHSPHSLHNSPSERVVEAEPQLPVLSNANPAWPPAPVTEQNTSEQGELLMFQGAEAPEADAVEEIEVDLEEADGNYEAPDVPADNEIVHAY